MKIVLIGANGQLGTDLQKIIPSEFLIPLTIENIDVTKKDRVLSVIAELRPNLIINTAAFHQVDICEDEINESFKTNAIALAYLSDACLKNDCTLVHCSTDYVFGQDKNRSQPYTENDSPAPINIYGVSKLAGEKIISYRLKKYFIIRTSGLFGTAGAAGKGGNFVELMIRLGKEKGQVKVVNDQILTPTYTLNLAENIWRLIQTDHYGLYHLTAEGQCSWYEFANKIFNLLNMSVNCSPCSSVDFPTRASRPAYSVLENKKLKDLNLNIMKHWSENLTNYLQEKGHLIK